MSRVWKRRIALVVTTAGVLVAAGAFSLKIFGFLFTLGSAEADGFAAVPVTTYFIVATGYGALFLWALLTGQLKDLERPKHRMLEQEEMYERIEASSHA